jgi:ADP-ribose pyrophosphatase YjhB (NUDIX family)
MIEKAGVVIAKKSNDGTWNALLVQQKHSLLWSLPKGSQLSSKESWQKCARRELAEETGLFIEIEADAPC